MAFIGATIAVALILIGIRSKWYDKIANLFKDLYKKIKGIFPRSGDDADVVDNDGGGDGDGSGGVGAANPVFVGVDGGDGDDVSLDLSFLDDDE